MLSEAVQRKRAEARGQARARFDAEYGGTEPPTGGSEDPPLPADSYGLVKAARRAWESDPKLRVEFGDCFERYVAYRRADEKGLVKIFSRGRPA